MNALNPGTINRARPEFKQIEIDNSPKINENFFGETVKGDEAKAIDPEFQAALKSGKATPNERQSRAGSVKSVDKESTGVYQFNLSRDEIGRPGRSSNLPESSYKKNIAKLYGMTPGHSSDSRSQLSSH